MKSIAEKAGRDPAHIEVIGAVTQGPKEPERLVSGVRKWEKAGATQCTVRTSSHPIVWRADLPAAEKSAAIERHLDALRRFRRAWDER
jgi:hypothetical protein